MVLGQVEDAHPLINQTRKTEVLPLIPFRVVGYGVAKELWQFLYRPPDE